MYEWIGLVAILVAIVYALMCFVILHGPYVFVTTNWPSGTISRVLSNGFHLLYPLESVHHHTWSFPNQQYGTSWVRDWRLPTHGTQVDVAPMECVSADNHVVSLDLFLVYFVGDASKTVCRSGDPLLLLCQQVATYAREEVGRVEAANLSRSAAAIGKTIVERVAREWTPTYGLALEGCVIQSVSLDEETINRRRKMRDGLSAADCARIEQAKAYGVQGAARVFVQ